MQAELGAKTGQFEEQEPPLVTQRSEPQEKATLFDTEERSRQREDEEITKDSAIWQLWRFWQSAL